MEDPQVLLLSMPFGALERPALGLGILQAVLRRNGRRCTTRYLGPIFARRVGIDDYTWLTRDLPYTAFAGDWLFADALAGARDPTPFIDEVLQGEWLLDDASVARLLAMRAHCEPFLDHVMAAIEWRDVDLVGFTSTFEQNIASLALASRIKAAHPEVLVVFGGANWEGEMGAALARHHPFVDAVCPGEADDSFPALVDAFAGGEPLESVAGVIVRVGDDVVVTDPAPEPVVLDHLPMPDFDDWYAAFAADPDLAARGHVLLAETSRGCWWGARSHCTFCGLNGEAMSFRSKSPERAVDEIVALVERYGATQVNLVDNILDMRYFRTVLPVLAERVHGVRVFYETKASLSHRQVRALALAGVLEVQPGIESMSDHVLDLMRKGTNALVNIQVLKWCREFGVAADWNLLYGFPGETEADYLEMIPLLRAMAFLGPPTACGPIRLDRFSPFHADPASFGMTDVRAIAPYRFLYPDVGADLDRIAYYFDFDYADGRTADEFAAPVIELVRRWQDDPAAGGLWWSGTDDGDVVIHDQRVAGHPRTIELDGWQADLHRACDRAQPVADLARLAVPAGVAVAEVAAFVNDLVDQQLAIVRRRSCLALAVHRTPRLDAADRRPSRRLALRAAAG